VNAAALATVTAELRARLDRLVARPVPPPRAPVVTYFDRYQSLCQRIRAQQEAS